MADAPRNDALRDALRVLQDGDTAQARLRVHEQIRAGTLLVPVTGSAEDPEALVDTGEPLQLVTLPDPEGKVALPVFTDEEALRAWMPEGRYVAVPGEALVRMLAERPPDRLLINVAGPIRAELDASQIRLLVGGERGVSQQVGAGTTVSFREPESMPVGLVPRVREVLADHDGIVEGFLLTAAVGDREPQLTLAVVLADGGDEGSLPERFQTIGEQVSDSLAGASLSMLPLQPDLAAQLRERFEPVYEGF